MANIRTDIDFMVVDGAEIIFKAPCDSCTVTGLKVYYPNSDGITVNEVFEFKDAHGNALTDIDTFKANAMVKVILNTTDKTAYIQNADTNAYLEGRFDEKADTADLANYLPLSVGEGETIVGTGYNPLTIESGSANAFVSLKNKNGIFGRVGITSEDDTLFYMNNSGANRKILHTGNYVNYVTQNLGVLAIPETQLNTLASDKATGGSRTYMATIQPTAPFYTSTQSYLCKGGSYTLIGMEYAEYKYGYQLVLPYSGNPKFRQKTNGTWSDWVEIFHTGNKPSGTYTGNGSATSRTINVGGIGSAVLVTSDNGTALLSNASPLLWKRSAVESASYDEASFKSGTIKLATTNDRLNANGVTYTYWSL